MDEAPKIVSRLLLFSKLSFAVWIFSIIFFIVFLLINEQDPSFGESLRSPELIGVSIIIGLASFILGTVTLVAYYEMIGKYESTSKKISPGFFISRFFLALLLSLVAGILTIPFLQQAGGLPYEQMSDIGGQNLWKIVIAFGAFTFIVCMLSFFKKSLRWTAAFIILFWLAGSSFVAYINSSSQGTGLEETEGNTTTGDIIDPESCDEQQSIVRAKNCTILVLGDEGYGSGFSIKDGFIISNRHVVEDTRNLSTWVDNVEIPLILWGYSLDADIAVLKLGTTIPVCNWANSNNIGLAETLYTVGWPNLAYGESSITKGIFSRTILSEQGPQFIQTDAAVNPGNSGGPIINKCGVVGINTSKLSWSDEYTPSEGFGFAISSVYAKRVIDNLVETGSALSLPVTTKEPVKYVPKESADSVVNEQQEISTFTLAGTWCTNPKEMISLNSIDVLGGGKVRINWTTTPRSTTAYHLFYSKSTSGFTYLTAIGSIGSYEVGGLPPGNFYFTVLTSWSESGGGSGCAASYPKAAEVK